MLLYEIYINIIRGAMGIWSVARSWVVARKRLLSSVLLEGNNMSVEQVIHTTFIRKKKCASPYRSAAVGTTHSHSTDYELCNAIIIKQFNAAPHPMYSTLHYTHLPSKPILIITSIEYLLHFSFLLFDNTTTDVYLALLDRYFTVDLHWFYKEAMLHVSRMYLQCCLLCMFAQTQQIVGNCVQLPLQRESLLIVAPVCLKCCRSRILLRKQKNCFKEQILEFCQEEMYNKQNRRSVKS